MPSYPLSFPASPYPQKVFARPRVPVAAFDNDYTLQQHVQLLSNARRWDVDFFMQKMDRVDAALWTQFIYDLQGRFGTFQFNLGPWCPGLSPAPGTRTFRLVLDDPGWDAELAVEFGFNFSAVEAL